MVKKLFNKILPPLPTWKERQSPIGAPIWDFLYYEIFNQEISLKDVIIAADIGIKSNGEFRRAIKQGSIKINDHTVSSPERHFCFMDLTRTQDGTIGIFISKGKTDRMFLRFIQVTQLPLRQRIRLWIDIKIEKYSNEPIYITTIFDPQQAT